MPLLDGVEATCLIRAFEKEQSPPTSLSERASVYGRIPVITVSVSLVEQQLDDYVNAGFDTWILKPIDFKRLEEIMVAVDDVKARKNMSYGVEPWARKGWFH